MSEHTYTTGRKGTGTVIHIVRVWDGVATRYTLCDGTGSARVFAYEDTREHPAPAATCKRCIANKDSATELEQVALRESARDQQVGGPVAQLAKLLPAKANPHRCTGVGFDPGCGACWQNEVRKASNQQSEGQR